LVSDVNPGDGRIRRLSDTGLAFSDKGTAPFYASLLVNNPALGDKYAAANGYNKETGATIAPNWVMTGEVSKVDGESAQNPNPGLFDGGNTGTSLPGATDLDAGPDGTVFSTQNADVNWIIGWTDRRDIFLGPINSAGSFSSNSDSQGAWVAVDPNAEADMNAGGSFVVQTASNDITGGEPSDGAFLRAWNWDTAATSISFRTQMSFDDALTMQEIAVIPNVGAPPATPGDYDGNNMVDPDDLNLVLFNWNMTSPVDWTTNVPSGLVGIDELNAVLFNWGNSQSIATVPEPSALTLLLLGGVVCLVRRR